MMLHLAILAKFVTFVTSNPLTDEQKCTLLDPEIRSDCGTYAAGNDRIVTKQECLEAGCCWDTEIYKVKSPWCYYPFKFSFGVIQPTPSENDVEDDSNDPTVKPQILVEKVIVERVVVPTTKPITTTTTPPPTPSGIMPNFRLPTKTSSNPVTLNMKLSEDEKEGGHVDLVTAYRKKTCQQLNATSSLNETMRELTMERMKCDTVDFASFNASADPNLNKDTSEGMKVLLQKYKQAAAEKTEPTKSPLLEGGIYSVFDDRRPDSEDDLKGISETEKMILKNPLMVRMMPEKVKKIRMKTNGCKTLTKEYAPEYAKKSGFSTRQKSNLKRKCGSVPTDSTMSNLLKSLGLLKVAEDSKEKKWNLPNEKIEYDLIGWHTMEVCLAKMDRLNEKYNCYNKSDDIYDYKTCTQKGCIFYQDNCFYCEAAIQNQRENRIVVNSASDDKGECAVPASKKSTCRGFDKDTTLDKLLQMNVRGDGKMDPTLSILMKRQKKKKCEKLGCCYKAGSKTKDIMMLMMSQNQQNQGGFNPAMFLGRKRRSAGLMSLMSRSGGGLGSLGGLGALMGGGGQNMNQLLMSKMMSDDDEFDCYAPLDTEFNEPDQCMPSRERNECGNAQADSDGSDQPWHVVIGDKDGKLHCGATMICAEWAITTASCLKKLENEFDEDFKLNDHARIYHDVTTGASLSVKGEIEKVVYHPLFGQNSSPRFRLLHDIAVVHVRLVSPVMPICLPEVVDPAPSSVHAFGFGRYGFNTGEEAGTIKKTQFNIQSNSACESAYGNIDFSAAFCGRLSLLSIQYKPICEGDRGGAASSFRENGWTLDAVIAGGPSDCDYSDKPAVFISVHNELQWILEATNNCCTVLSMFR